MILKGSRRHQAERMEVADEREAVAITYWAIEDNTWRPEWLENDAGEVLLDNEALMAAVWKYGDEHDG